MDEVKYAGFWVRLVATFLDTLLLALPVAIVIYFLSDGNWFDLSKYQQNLSYAMSGNSLEALTMQPQISFKWELLFEVSVLLISMLFWRRWRGATPGKKILRIKIVDAKSYKDINNKQAIIRTFGYIISTLTLLIGFLMVAFRTDKRSLHDLLAGTAVIYDDSKKS